MKKAIVVGATSGIGRELAKKLIKKGYKVGITGRRGNQLLEIKKENPDAYITSDFDISDALLTKQKLDELVTELGGLDLLILCSGIGETNDNLDINIDATVIGTNIFGFTQIMNWGFKLFSSQGNGHLICLTSVAGLRGSRHAPSYNASKAYQINYLEGLRQKISNSALPINLTDVRPGFVETAMAKGEGLFWVVPLNKAANQILEGINSKKDIIYISKRWSVVALLYQRIPNMIYEKL